MAGPIRISVLANASQANRTLNQTATTASRMGSGIKKAALPAAAALGAIAKVGFDAVKSLARVERINAATAQVIKTTGGAARVTAGHVEGLANKLERMTTTEAESVQEGANMLLTFTNIRNGVGKTNQIFDRGVAIVTDMSRALGTDLKQQSIQVGKALNDPIKGVGALSRVGVSFTEQQKKQIKTLVESGRTMDAQKIILGELSKEFGGAGKAFAQTTEGKIEAAKNAFGNLTESLAARLLPAVARLATIGTQGLEWLTKHKTASLVLVGVLGSLAVAILAVNAAMLVNPAVLVVAGIAALVAALVVAYQRSEGFRRVVDSVATTFRTQVLPALRQFGAYVVGTVVPAVVKVVQAIGARLKPILTQLGNTFRTQIQPTIAKVVAKFREMSPTIGRVVSFVAKMYAGYLKFVAAVAGKVIPIVIRFAGFLIGKVVPAIADVIGFLITVADNTIKFGKAVVNAGKDAVAFARKVVTKVGEVVTTVAGLPGKALEALGDIGSTLINAGKDLIQGLIDGIDDALQGLKDKLGAVTDLIPDWKGPPEKDAVLLRPAGRSIMQGLVDGITDGTPGVEKVLGKVTRLIETTIGKRIKNDAKARAAIKRTVAGLREEYAALTRNARAQDKIARQLEQRRQALKDLIQTSKDYATGIKDTIVGFGSVTAAGEGTGFADAGGLLEVLRARLAQARDYAAKIKALIKAGLNQTTIQQLLDAGVEGGLGTASTILAGGSQVIAQVNAITAQLTTAGQGLGDSAANTMYGAGIQAAQGLIRGLEAQARALDRIARRLAKTLIEAVKKALKIKSPSRVFRDLGRYTARGLTIGLEDVDLRGAGLRMADLLTRGFAAPTLDAALAGGAGSQVMTIDLRLSADQVDQLARGRKIQADLDAYRRAGGRAVA